MMCRVCVCVCAGARDTLHVCWPKCLLILRRLRWADNDTHKDERRVNCSCISLSSLPLRISVHATHPLHTSHSRLFSPRFPSSYFCFVAMVRHLNAKMEHQKIQLEKKERGRTKREKNQLVHGTRYFGMALIVSGRMATNERTKRRNAEPLVLFFLIFFFWGSSPEHDSAADLMGNFCGNRAHASDWIGRISMCKWPMFESSSWEQRTTYAHTHTHTRSNHDKNENETCNEREIFFCPHASAVRLCWHSVRIFMGRQNRMFMRTTENVTTAYAQKWLDFFSSPVWLMCPIGRRAKFDSICLAMHAMEKRQKNNRSSVMIRIDSLQ